MTHIHLKPTQFLFVFNKKWIKIEKNHLISFVYFITHTFIKYMLNYLRVFYFITAYNNALELFQG